MVKSLPARIACSFCLGLVCAFLYFAGPMVELPRWLPELAYLGVISAILVVLSQTLGTLSLWQVVAHSIPVTAVTVVLARAMGGPLGSFIRPVAAVWLGASLVWAVSYYRRTRGPANLNAK